MLMCPSNHAQELFSQLYVARTKRWWPEQASSCQKNPPECEVKVQGYNSLKSMISGAWKRLQPEAT